MNDPFPIKDLLAVYPIVRGWRLLDETNVESISDDSDCVMLNYGEVKSLVSVLKWMREYGVELKAEGIKEEGNNSE